MLKLFVKKNSAYVWFLYFWSFKKKLMKQKFSIITLIFCICFAQKGFNQNKNDSIMQIILQTFKTDTVHILALTDWAFNAKFSNPDSSLLLAQQAQTLSEKIGFGKGICKANKIIGIYYQINGDYTKALDYYFLSAAAAKKINDRRELGKVYNNIGNIYRNQGIYEPAYEYFVKSLHIDEFFGDSIGISASFNNIGVIFDDQGNDDKALEYYTKALEIRLKLGDKSLLGISYNNIGHVYQNNKDNKTALVYFLKAYKIRNETKEVRGLISTCGNVAYSYIAQNQADSAYSYLVQGTELAETLKSKEQIVYIGNKFASYYLNKNQAEKALQISSRNQDIAKEIGNIEMIRSATTGKFQAYEKMGRFREALEEYKYYNLLKDSIANDANEKKILSREWIFKEDKLKAENRAKETQRELEKKREATVQTAFIIGSLLLFALLVVAYIAYRTKNKAVKIIKQQKNEIESKNSELIQLNEEISAQRDNLTDLTEQLQVQNTDILRKNTSITQSINYAYRIQNAILPDLTEFKQLIPNHFVLSKPRDIISGDFYFIKKINHFLIIAAADCTGHGVPGAFMSMLGVTLLNEIVRNAQITTSAQVLNELRSQLKVSLQQTGQAGEQQDGMDIAFCVLNLETNELSFAGAYNPLWIFRNSEIIEFQGDRQPVGIYIKEKPFIEQTITLQTGDVFYVFSDGFHSQFNSQTHQPMKIKYFKAFLAEIYTRPMHEQHRLLEEKFNTWRGNIEQTDDVLVIGVAV